MYRIIMLLVLYSNKFYVVEWWYLYKVPVPVPVAVRY